MRYVAVLVGLFWYCRRKAPVHLAHSQMSVHYRVNNRLTQPAARIAQIKTRLFLAGLAVSLMGCQSAPKSQVTSSATPVADQFQGAGLAVVFVEEVKVKPPGQMPSDFEHRLRALQLSQEGKLQPGPTSPPLGEAANCGLLAITSGRTLICVDSENRQASAFIAGADGTLKPGSVIGDLQSAMACAILPMESGQMLATDGAGYHILESLSPGQLKLLGAGQFPVKHSGPRSVYEFAYDSAHHCLWTASFEEPGLSSMHLDAKHQLQEGPKAKLAFSPGCLVIDPSGQDAYVWGDGAVHHLKIGKDSSMKEVASAPCKGDIFDVLYDDGGKRLVCVDANGTFQGFHVESSGQLKAGKPAELHKMLPVQRMQLDPSGQYLISASEGLRVLKFDANADLSLQSELEGIYSGVALLP